MTKQNSAFFNTISCIFFSRSRILSHNLLSCVGGSKKKEKEVGQMRQNIFNHHMKIHDSSRIRIFFKIPVNIICIIIIIIINNY